MSILISRFAAGVLLCGIALLNASAWAQTPAAKPAAKPAPAQAAAPGPKTIGSFDEWMAATYVEGGQTVCYAFTKAKTSAPAIPGRGESVLTVTQRTALRDAVALTAGFEYAANAVADLDIDKTKVELYTAKRAAFARDGHAVVQALAKAAKVTARSPHPQKKEVVDTFGLKGFNKAYEAISKACPAK